MPTHSHDLSAYLPEIWAVGHLSAVAADHGILGPCPGLFNAVQCRSGCGMIKIRGLGCLWEFLLMAHACGECSSGVLVARSLPARLVFARPWVLGVGDRGGALIVGVRREYNSS